MMIESYQFSKEFYDRNEITFFNLIHNTKSTKDDYMSKIGLTEATPFTKVLLEVFS